MKVGASVEVIKGKHAGEKGTVEGFTELSRGKDYNVKFGDKTVSLPYKTILVIA